MYLPQELYDSLEAPDEDEEDMFDLAVGVRDTSRLGCQVKVADEFAGVLIELPSEVVSQMEEDE